MKRKGRWAMFTIAQGAIVMAAITFPGSSGAAAPTGNSGTVKVDGLLFESHHANEPHPSCDFRITFWGYGVGRVATVAFALQAPTGATTGPGIVSYGPINIGGDAAGGGNDLDGTLDVNLATFLADSGATAHPKQGFHVKLTINATGSRGADVKHKVFWVKCTTGGGTPTPTPTPTPSETVTPTPTVSESVVTSPSPSASVLGKTIVKGRGLARTGVPAEWMGLIAAELLLLGSAMVLLPRRRLSAARVTRKH